MERIEVRPCSPCAAITASILDIPQRRITTRRFALIAENLNTREMNVRMISQLSWSPPGILKRILRDPNRKKKI